jgi:hypothetical protein
MKTWKVPPGRNLRGVWVNALARRHLEQIGVVSKSVPYGDKKTISRFPSRAASMASHDALTDPIWSIRQ